MEEPLTSVDCAIRNHRAANVFSHGISTLELQLPLHLIIKHIPSTYKGLYLSKNATLNLFLPIYQQTAKMVQGSTATGEKYKPSGTYPLSIP